MCVCGSARLGFVSLLRSRWNEEREGGRKGEDSSRASTRVRIGPVHVRRGAPALLAHSRTHKNHTKPTHIQPNPTQPNPTTRNRSKQVALLRKIFDSFDTEGRGAISRAQLLVALKSNPTILLEVVVALAGWSP